MTLHIVRFTTHPEQAEAVESAITGIPRAARFRQQMADWALSAPAPEPATVLGRYRILD